MACSYFPAMLARGFEAFFDNLFCVCNDGSTPSYCCLAEGARLSPVLVNECQENKLELCGVKFQDLLVYFSLLKRVGLLSLQNETCPLVLLGQFRNENTQN